MTVTATASDRAPVRSPNQTLAGNFDTFLKLLTTQLRQQDPLQPMDATTFTSQLVQYATVEQGIATNTKLESLANLVRGSQTAAALGLLGQQAVAATDRLQLPAEGGATISYRLPTTAETVQVSLVDQRGRTVWTGAGDATAGEHTLAWDGTAGDGQRAPAGEYRVRIEARDAAGKALAAEQLIVGRVEAVQTQGGELQVVVGGTAVPLEALRDIRRPA